MQLKTPDGPIREWLYNVLNEAIQWEGKVVPVYDGGSSQNNDQEIVFGQSTVTPSVIRSKDTLVYDCIFRVNIYTEETGTSQLDDLTEQVFAALTEASPNFHIDLGDGWADCTWDFNNYLTLPQQRNVVNDYTERILELRFICE